MIDAHIHISHRNIERYSLNHIESFVEQAQKRDIKHIYLLEHTHQFYEFKQMYKPIEEYNEYQKKWLSTKLTASFGDYIDFVEAAGKYRFPIAVSFGLEVCYIPETKPALLDILKQANMDFIVGAVHFIDNWGFDHRAEHWDGRDIDNAYMRYYEIMLDMIKLGVFDGVAHPDSIKCFGNYPSYDLEKTYENIAKALVATDMYAEQSGGLALNYGFPELGMNAKMLRALKRNGVRIVTASDAHKPEHVGLNIRELHEIFEKT